jgi:hypothetical protein
MSDNLLNRVPLDLREGMNVRSDSSGVVRDRPRVGETTDGFAIYADGPNFDKDFVADTLVVLEGVSSVEYDSYHREATPEQLKEFFAGMNKN